mmetsp:Transcript_2784/g.4762  ORF Transcript_2784/g.4762 Transcript_2784/m.4762 type:complete len:148 (+) Transcript_2784:42-485(+)
MNFMENEAIFQQAGLLGSVNASMLISSEVKFLKNDEASDEGEELPSSVEGQESKAKFEVEFQSQCVRKALKQMDKDFSSKFGSSYLPKKEASIYQWHLDSQRQFSLVSYSVSAFNLLLFGLLTRVPREAMFNSRVLRLLSYGAILKA